MRKIEKMMLDAIREKRNFRSGNTEVIRCYAAMKVYLHNNHIATICDGGQKEFTLAGWNTPTTRSRLRALGVGVCQKDYLPYYEGKMIDSMKWYGVQ